MSADYRIAELPNPLPPKQQNELLKRLANGDKTARKTLIETNLRLALRIAKKFARNDDNKRDVMFSDGCLGLIRATGRYNPDKGPFLAFAAAWIRGSILQGLKKEAKAKCRTTEANVKCRTISVDPEKLEGVADPHDDFAAVDARLDAEALAAKAMKRLTPREQKLVRALADDEKVAAIARRLKTTPARVKKRLDRIREKTSSLSPYWRSTSADQLVVSMRAC
jgi:RNA polymerase sigma factor (sigma-70 family)